MSAPSASTRAGPRPLSFGRRLAYLAEAAGFFALMALFRALGLERASAFGGWLARTLGPLLAVSRRARLQLAFAMPELGPAETARIERGMWDNLGRTFAEYPHLDRLSREIATRVRIEGAENMRAAIARGQGVVLFSGHFANWEVMPAVVRHLGATGAAVYRAVNNPHVDRWLVAQRTRWCFSELVPKGRQGARRLIEILKSGQCLAMLVDQKMNDGTEAPFFGHPAMTPAAPAQFAQRLGAALVPVAFARTNGANFAMRILPALDIPAPQDRHAAAAAVLAEINRFLEREVRARPEQWLWLHRRWGKDVTRAGAMRASAAPPTADRAAPETS